jgi:hypothetical protein
MSSQRHSCTLSIDGNPFTFEVEGDFTWGADEVLSDENKVISQTSWQKEGYAVLPMFDVEAQQRLIEGTRNIILGLFREFGFEHSPDFQLGDYHKVVDTGERHQQIIKRTRMLANADFPVEIEKVAQQTSAALRRKVSPYNRMLERMENLPAKEIVQLRISRPHSLDINPMHRDGYLDFYKHTLNCWIPISGCTPRTSLPVIPGSHMWKEKDVYRTQIRSAKINGLLYSVPAILQSKNGMNAMRPNPKLGEMLIFSPFLIHGAAVNESEDETRMSFELRLFDEEAVL